MKIGIIGKGFVGKAMMKLFPDAIGFGRDANQDEINACDIVFVCVPTPLKEGKLDTSIVENVVDKCFGPLIVIRSTLNPGTCDSFAKNIVMMPEYVGETVQHPLLNEGDRPFLIIGGEPKNRRRVIELFQTVYNANINIRQVTNLEAEVIKLSENRAIAYVISQCRELYDVCELAGVDYYTVRDAVYGDDPRFNLWWTFVYPDAKGFSNSKCLPKDVRAWNAWAEGLGYDPEITKLLIKKDG